MITKTIPSKTKSMWVRFKLYISAVVFAVLIGLVENWIGWQKLLAPWLDLAPSTLVTAMIFIFVSYILRTLRLYGYFMEKMCGRFWVCFKLVLQHNFLNNLLPMRSGEISFPVLMSRYFSVPVIHSIPALLWFRILDLHTIIGFALFPFTDTFLGTTAAIIALLAWIPLPLLIFRFHDCSLKYLNRKSESKIKNLMGQVLKGLPNSDREFWHAWLWTLINWLVKLAVFTWVILLFLDVSVGTAWLAVIAGDVTSILPIHGIAGAGTYEAGIVAALLPLGVSANEGLPAALNLHLFILSSSIIGGLLALFIPSRIVAR